MDIIDFGNITHAINDEYENSRKIQRSVNFSIIKRCLKEKLFCDSIDFNINEYDEILDIHLFIYNVNVEITHEEITIKKNAETYCFYLNEFDTESMDEFVERLIREKCDKEYQNVIRTKKLNRILSEER